MVLTDGLVQQGFSLLDANMDDLDRYIEIKKACYKKYMDEYNGGWIDDIQVVILTDGLKRMVESACCKKILLNGMTVGFFSYGGQAEKIDGISIQMLEEARNKGMGSFYLNHITALSRQTGKPAYLVVHKSNPAEGLFRRFGFKVYDESRTHYLMSFNQENASDFSDYRKRLQ
ncbi:GNAT family N-acetyltransferase [Lachnospiraceae bacterium 54-53]